jgi:hypothetical protein
MADPRVTFFSLLLKLKQIHESYNGFTMQEIAAVDQELLAPLLEFAHDVEGLGKEIEIRDMPAALMTWPKFIAIEGHKLRSQDPTLTQPQILQMLGPLWKQRNAELGF